jgi:hypothetical protein
MLVICVRHSSYSPDSLRISGRLNDYERLSDTEKWLGFALAMYASP